MIPERDAIDAFGREKRLRSEVLGWSIDSDRQIVTFFVPENEPLSGFPARLAGLDVELVPLPRSTALREAG
jgi:hypothetical protein